MIELNEIVDKFNLSQIGTGCNTILKVTDLNQQCENGLTWIKSSEYIDKISCGVILIHEKLKFVPKENVTYLITKENTKLIFSKIVHQYFTPDIDYYLYDDSAKHKNNKAIKIANNVFIGQNVTIGNGTIVHPFVTIEANSIIGKNCIIKTQTSIGTEGLGLSLDKETDSFVKFPQIGNTVLENNVEIGPNSTVRRGALVSTRIMSGTKIGSLVNIGHNCVIGRNVIMTCNNVISGSVTIGDYTYIGVKAMIRNGIQIGSNTLIGMGAVVTKPVPNNVVVYGSPAKIIRDNV